MKSPITGRSASPPVDSLGGARFHLTGVGGVGMSALAGILRARGHAVSGSDRLWDRGIKTPALLKLQTQGVVLVPQDGAGLNDGAKVLVVSTAIETDNADIQAAERLQIPILHRAEVLARLIGDRVNIAVTGTSGKTTVTGMIGWILSSLGADPTVVNGGAVIDWITDRDIGHVRKGRDDLWVVEADESDRSLLSFRPDWAVITNISADHFNLPDTVDLFATFAQRVESGTVCFPDTAERIQKHVDSGVAGKLIVADAPIEERAGSWCFRCAGKEMKSRLPGRHNAENALLAATLCRALGCDPTETGEALLKFGGIERRLQKLDSPGDVVVLDDYAHNPAKIRAAWETARTMGRRVLGIWRPHGYGPLAAMADDLMETMEHVMESEARLSDPSRGPDRLLVLDVYYAGGSAKRDITSAQFADQLRKRGVSAEHVPDYEGLERELNKEVRAGDVVLFMGARDPELPEFARRFAERLLL